MPSTIIKKIMPFIGSHILKDPKGVLRSMAKLEGLGANCFQLFLSPTLGKLSDRSFESMMDESGDVAKYLKKMGYRLFVHLPYTLNTAKDTDGYWVDAIVKDMTLADAMGADGCVLHVGKAVKLDEQVALENMYQSISKVLKKCEAFKARMFLETAAGQGSELCVGLEELGDFYRRFNGHPRLGICIDTAHIWGAGWDFDGLFNRLEKHIGVKNIGLFHFNNSKVVSGARVDRHENLETGKICIDVLKNVAKECVKHKIPMILETPLCLLEVPLLWKLATEKEINVDYNQVEAAFLTISMD